MTQADTPAVSVIVGSHGSDAALAACLEALEPQRDGAEVIVCEARESPTELRERFSWARFIPGSGVLVPELWRDGIDSSRGRVAALTNSSMLPAPDWLAVIQREHARHDVVAGAIEPGEGLRVADWAEYFCRYSPDMLPFEGHESLNLPGDNAAYKREQLDRTRDLYRDGFWEPVVHARLAAEGEELWQAPELVVRQSRSSGAAAFVRQRLTHGRSYGHQRAETFSRGRTLVGVAASPLVPLVLTARMLARVFAKRRHRARALLALPHILLFNVAWGLGEARGHVDYLVGR